MDIISRRSAESGSSWSLRQVALGTIQGRWFAWVPAPVGLRRLDFDRKPRWAAHCDGVGGSFHEGYWQDGESVLVAGGSSRELARERLSALIESLPEIGVFIDRSIARRRLRELVRGGD